ncbi:unnamed protein product [Didymodactylos carnosus]|uniref:RING-type domain-containing protein n=1 Tax=Didymodactylos carnosus TaxID=1234261 RepID=A0A8S2J4Z2_9BILA|nr:unnamed protein product [Didymodactylos carnosus]CAF3780737.1 unnamed protein product [Didymodactylos carnosus]
MTKTQHRNLKTALTFEPIENHKTEVCCKSFESSLPQKPQTSPRTTAEKQFLESKEKFNRELGPIIKEIQQTFTNSRAQTDAQIKAAGFSYTANNNDSVQCSRCKIEIFRLTKEMKLFEEHEIRSPECPYVKEMRNNNELNEITKSKPQKLQKTEAMTCVGDAATKKSFNKQKQHGAQKQTQQNVTSHLSEIQIIRDVRKHTYSHWPHKNPSKAQMTDAGFFSCNIGDRVICIYCNIICQQWIPYKDDPVEIHKLLSPNCPYVRSILIKNASMNNICILNEVDHKSSQQVSASGNNNNSTNVANIRSNEIVLTAACNQQYIELPKRTTSFATWPTEPLPLVDDLVKSGFFYTGTKTIVTCFYCNGSLQNWGPNDNPLIEHSRWFPHCAYARQLCGDDLYRKIQESKRAAQERTRSNEQQQKNSFSILNINETSNNNSGIAPNSRQLQIPDEATLSRLVAARLDWPISQSLLNKNFKLSIIKRCFEDQLRLKHNDFISDSDLLLACIILQKQIEYIDGKKENIVIPSVFMKKLAEQAEKERADKEKLERNTCHSNQAQTTSLRTTLSSSSSSTGEDADMASLTNESVTSNSSSCSIESNINVKSIDEKPKPKLDLKVEVSNPCVLCLTDERRLACIPCGHLATCVPCGHSLRTCPICRKQIEAFVRVYI